ncbi:hypothetical protein ES707_14850 [subsurface metagenome]
MSKEYTRLVSIVGEIPFANQIVFHDDFEHTLQWTKGGGVGDSIFELSPNISKHGNQSLHLKTRTTGAAQSDAINAERFMHLRPSKLLNLIYNFYSPNLTKAVQINLYFTFADGTNAHESSIRFNPNAPDWQYMPQGKSFTTIAGSELALNNLAWHQAILRVNFATQKYLTLQVDHLLFDLSALSYHISTSGAGLYLGTKIEIVTVDASPAELYIDDVTLHEI